MKPAPLIALTFFATCTMFLGATTYWFSTGKLQLMPDPFQQIAEAGRK